MKSIPVLFELDPVTKLATEKVTKGCEWVIRGEGRASRKFDGVACLFLDGVLYKRLTVVVWKPSPGKVGMGIRKLDDFMRPEDLIEPVVADYIPDGFIAAEDPHWRDDGTAEVYGWVRVSKEAPQDAPYREALRAQEADMAGFMRTANTFELVGPKINGNPEHFERHTLLMHGCHVLMNSPRSYEEVREFLSEHDWEGIVYNHEDGRMARIRRKDFGLPWPV